jgi:hypothetical protein
MSTGVADIYERVPLVDACLENVEIFPSLVIIQPRYTYSVHCETVTSPACVFRLIGRLSELFKDMYSYIRQQRSTNADHSSICDQHVVRCAQHPGYGEICSQRSNNG